MSSGSGLRARAGLLPLLSLLPAPEREPLPEPPPATRPWCPRDVPRTPEFGIYWQTVDVLGAAHEAGVAPRARDTLVAAFIETRNAYADAGPLGAAAEFFDNLGDDCEMTPRALPDLCAALSSVPFWGHSAARAPSYLRTWAVFLGQVLPNPCRARAFAETVKRRIDRPEFHDYILRVVFAALLGVYPGDAEVVGVRERMVLFAAFSLNPPTAWQMARFAEIAPQFVLFACRQHLFFTIRQVPALHEFLRETYYWEEMERAVTAGLASARAHVLAVGLHPGFLDDANTWSRCETLLFAQNQHSLCYCYRAAVKPFHEKILSEYERLTRTGSAFRPTPTAVQLMDAHAFVARFRTPGLLSFDLADPARWPDGVLPPHLLRLLVDAKATYDNETQMTSSVGALKRIHAESPEGYNALFSMLTAIAGRLAIRWQRLPLAWARAQAEAVARLDAGARENGARENGNTDAGEYMLCPKCKELRAVPIEYPAGIDERTRASSRFPAQVSIRMNAFAPVRLICHARGIRKHDATAKRHEHNARKKPSKRAKRIDPIPVCSDVEVLRINLVGILLYTRVNGLVTLCVDCGALLKWTRGCLSERGPTCGCRLETLERVVPCDICRKRGPVDSMRAHTVLRKTGLAEVVVCRAHNTQWIDAMRAVPIFSEVREAVLKRRARIRVGSSYVFFDRRPRRGRR